jgi:hypothetical protein
MFSANPPFHHRDPFALKLQDFVPHSHGPVGLNRFLVELLFREFVAQLDRDVVQSDEVFDDRRSWSAVSLASTTAFSGLLFSA